MTRVSLSLFCMKSAEEVSKSAFLNPSRNNENNTCIYVQSHSPMWLNFTEIYAYFCHALFYCGYVLSFHIILLLYTSWPKFTIKTTSYGYRNPHYKFQTVSRPSQVGIPLPIRRGLLNEKKPRALSCYGDLTLLQEFQPTTEQLLKKAASRLAKILATASCRSSDTGPSVISLAVGQ